MTSYDDMTMREAATHYYEKYGWVIVPNHPRDKKPSIPDWNKCPLATYDDIDVHYQTHERDNIGIHPLYSGVVVLDFDNHPDEEIATGPFKGHKRDGLKSYNDMLEAGLLREKAVTINSPSGGIKQIYWLPKGYTVNDSKDTIAPGLEVLCRSHQAVIPPSIHPLGIAYEYTYSPATVVEEDRYLPEAFLTFSAEKGVMYKNDSAAEVQGSILTDGEEVPQAVEQSTEGVTLPPKDIRDIPVAEWIYENYRQDIVFAVGKGDKGEFHIYNGIIFELDRERGYQKFIKTAVKKMIDTLEADKLSIEREEQPIKGNYSPRYEEACRRLKDSKKYLDYKCMTSLWNLMKGDVARDTRKFDSNYNILNFQNCTLEIDAWNYREHRQSDMLRKYAPVNYDPDAQCPKFKEELCRAFNGNEEEITYIKVLFGRTLQRKPMKGLVNFYGPSDVGKTTILNTVMKVLGDDADSGYSVAGSPRMLSASKSNEVTRNDILMTKNCCIVGIDEKNADEKDDSSFVKSYTGGSKVNCRGLYEANELVNVSATIFNTCNKLPPFDATDSGMVNRQIVVPFETPIKEKIPEYWDILYLEEGDGILNWLLEGLQHYIEHGMPEMPSRFKKATDDYVRDNNVVGRFIDVKCIIAPDSVENRIQYSEFEKALRDFCVNEESINERYIPGKRKILDVLSQKKVQFTENSTKIGKKAYKNVLRGIRLKTSGELEEETSDTFLGEFQEPDNLNMIIGKVMMQAPGKESSLGYLREKLKPAGISDETLRRTIDDMLNRKELMMIGDDEYQLINTLLI